MVNGFDGGKRATYLHATRLRSRKLPIGKCRQAFVKIWLRTTSVIKDCPKGQRGGCEWMEWRVWLYSLVGEHNKALGVADRSIAVQRRKLTCWGQIHTEVNVLGEPGWWQESAPKTREKWWRYCRRLRLEQASLNTNEVLMSSEFSQLKRDCYWMSV